MLKKLLLICLLFSLVSTNLYCADPIKVYNKQTQKNWQAENHETKSALFLLEHIETHTNKTETEIILYSKQFYYEIYCIKPKFIEGDPFSNTYKDIKKQESSLEDFLKAFKNSKYKKFYVKVDTDNVILDTIIFDK